MNERVPVVVREEVERLAGRPVADHEALVDDVGLRSLDLAQLVAVLELKLDVLPFVERFAITDLRTVGDVIRAFSAMVD